MYCLLLGKISCSTMTAPLLTKIIIIGIKRIERESVEVVEQCHYFRFRWKISSDRRRFSKFTLPTGSSRYHHSLDVSFFRSDPSRRKRSFTLFNIGGVLCLSIESDCYRCCVIIIIIIIANVETLFMNRHLETYPP